MLPGVISSWQMTLPGSLHRYKIVGFCTGQHRRAIGHDRARHAANRCRRPVIRVNTHPVLRVGKEHIYIWENDETLLHENDAAKILYDLCANEHMRPSEIKEGKIELLYLLYRQRLFFQNKSLSKKRMLC
mgnify:CR=1 FL=1